MSLSTEGMGPADIAAITGNNANNGPFGNDGAWWIIILFLFAFAGGWGNNGWGGAGAGGVSENYTLISDMGQLERKIDTVNNGLCDGFYSTAQLINGVNMQGANNTAAIQNTLTQGFAGLNTGMIQQANGITNAVNTGFCQTNFNAANNTRDIIDN